MLRRVTESGTSGVDLDDVLLAVERAAPVDAMEAVTRTIGVSLDPLWVSFLVADMSGRALVRLVHLPIGDLPGARRQDEDIAVVLPLDGGPRSKRCAPNTCSSSASVISSWCGRQSPSAGRSSDCWRTLCLSRRPTRQRSGRRGRRGR